MLTTLIYLRVIWRRIICTEYTEGHMKEAVLFYFKVLICPEVLINLIKPSVRIVVYLADTALDTSGIQTDTLVCGLQLRAEPFHSHALFRLPTTFVCSPSLAHEFIEYRS
jgi:hypothetical protein